MMDANPHSPRLKPDAQSGNESQYSFSDGDVRQKGAANLLRQPVLVH